MFHRRRPATTTTRTSKPTLMTRLKGRNARSRTVKTTTTTVPTHGARGTHGTHAHRGHAYNSTPARHHRRKTTLGDKVSGAMLKLKGTLTHRPAVKAAGTRRMHGTDGRGAHRVY